jgi:hypothetical protein
MIPWERDIYIELLRRHIEEENSKIRDQQNTANMHRLLRRR